MKKIVNTSNPQDRVGAAVSLCGLLVLSACGGGTETHEIANDALISTHASDRRLSQWSSPYGLIAAAPNELVRVQKQFISNESFRYPSDRSRAAGFIAELDDARIPFKLVECDWVNLGYGTIGVPMGIIIDIQKSNIAKVENMGFVISTDQNAIKFFRGFQQCNEGGSPIDAGISRIAGYAALKYPEYFYLSDYQGQYEKYTYRHFSQSGNYIGLDGDKVYVHNGKDWNFLYIGKLTDFIPTFGALDEAR